MRVPTFTEDQLRLLDVVYAGFMEIGDWPTTAYVDWELDHEHGLDFDDVLVTMPTDAVFAPGDYNERALVTPTIAALRSVQAATDDLR